MNRFLLACCIAVAPGFAAANEFCDVAGRVDEVRREIDAKWELFKARKLSEVEAFHAGLVAQHETGRISDARLARYLNAFKQGEPWVEPLLLEWVRLYPPSYAARYALAAHYARAGWAARGTEFAPKTSGEQFEAMRRQFEKSFKVLEEADALAKKPTLSHALRIDMGAAVGADITALYRTAIQAHPDTIQVRIEYIRKSAQRWGGGIPRLKSIIDDAAALPEAERRYIRYLALQEMGVQMQVDKSFEKAVAYFKESAPLCVGVDNSLRRMMHVQMVELRQFDAGVATASELIRRDPRDGDAWENRAWAYHQMGRHQQALPDFHKAVELGMPKSHFYLGVMYESGMGVAKDSRKALDHFLAAARQRVPQARERAEHLAKATGLPLQ